MILSPPELRDGRTADEPAFRYAELVLGVFFPEGFREFLQDVAGERLAASARGGPLPAGRPLDPDPWAPDGIVEATGRLGRERDLPAGVVPFLARPDGSLLCLDYRVGEPFDERPVVAWFPALGGAAGVCPVAASFEEFAEAWRRGDLHVPLRGARREIVTRESASRA